MALGGYDWVTLAVVAAGALAGGFTNGLTGFGTGLTALPFWVQVLDPLLAAQLSAASAVASQLTTLPNLWRELNWRRLAAPLLGGLAGMVAGLCLVPYVSLGAFKLIVGLVLVVYCTVMLIAAGRIKLSSGGSGAEAAVGFAGGVLGGIAGVPAPPAAMWVALRAFPMQERRIFLQAFNVTVLSAMMAVSAATGLLGPRFLWAFAISLPASVIGVGLGWLAYRRLDNRRFDHIVLGVLLLSGIVLIWSGR